MAGRSVPGQPGHPLKVAHKQIRSSARLSRRFGTDHGGGRHGRRLGEEREMSALEKTAPEFGQILPAIQKAMGQVQKVGKADRNKHDGYNFASIDNFLELVNPICAENGLIVHMQEGAREDFERQGRSGTSSWMRQSFDITLMHVSGETLPPVTRTVEVLRNGAQAYGSAQSYALKQFWRCVLLIPTGDKDDADHQATDAGPVQRESASARGLQDAWRDGVMDSLPENATPRQKAEAFADAIVAEFTGKGEKALSNAWDRRKKLIDEMETRHPELHEKIVDAFMTRQEELEDAKREKT